MPGPPMSTVHVTHGPVTIDVDEDLVSLRAFWSLLGRHLALMEGKDPGQRSYERYMEHAADMTRADGYELDPWQDIEQKYRDSWAHAEG